MLKLKDIHSKIFADVVYVSIYSGSRFLYNDQIDFNSDVGIDHWINLYIEYSEAEVDAISGGIRAKELHITIDVNEED